MDRPSFRKELSRERSARGSSVSVLVAYFAVYFFMLAEPDRHCLQPFLLGAGLCPVAARGPLVAGRPLVAEHELSGTQTSGAVARGLSRCLSRAPEQRLSSCGEVPASTGDEALFQCTKPSGVPRGPSHLQFP